MSVLDRFPKRPPEEMIQRGRALHQQGRADAYATADAQSVEGKVHDQGSSYNTVIAWENGSPLACQCGCNEFARHQVCRHVIATALQAAEEGYFAIKSDAPPRETRPRGQRGVMWISSDGRVRRLDQEDEPRPVVNHKPQPPSWKKQLEKLRALSERQEQRGAPPGSEPWPQDRQMLYIVDLPQSIESDALVIRLAARDRRSGGEWSRPKTRGVRFPPVQFLSDPLDQQILALLESADDSGMYSMDVEFEVPANMQHHLAQLVCQSGRALLRANDADETEPLAWDAGAPWQLWLEGIVDETAQAHVLSGWLRREGSEKIPVTRPLLITEGGVIFFPGSAGRLEPGAPLPWIQLLRSQRSINVPIAQSTDLLGELLEMGQLPRLDLPEALRVETVTASPSPRLRVRAPAAGTLSPTRLRAELSFDYAGLVVRRSFEVPRHSFDGARRRIVARDGEAEAKHARHLASMGMREVPGEGGGTEFQFHHRHLPRIIRALVQKGWHVEADGKLYRQPGKLRLNVSSGIDWFELRGEVDFDGKTVKLPELLAALRRGENSVTLGDGTVGMLPEAWLKRYGLLAAMGDDEADFIKFSKSQVGLLDALLAEQGDATCDEVFAQVRDQLRRFDGIVPEDPAGGFQGELRPYQRDGLGWFSFLRQFGFGGCLADDMGLGKTVQVLALLTGRSQGSGFGVQEQSNPSTGPSLVVVPRSLVFNWKQEATRFAPGLRVLDHTGIDRGRSVSHFKDYDLVLTTYGTLRRDAVFLKDVSFDYVILDEAQAVKNPASESAKAARLVKGRHRLALSGTPVQNHLGDLWSLFDFLNPGMLGAASVFGDTSSSLKNPEPETRALLARALRPFILRRTKEQVASDLPPKLEQTIYCELEAPQRKLYDELKAYYRRSLLERVDREGLGKNKMQILEALLRLRQASLHPGLIDEKRADEPSAKLDVLLPQLAEVIDEGHKALVFSQFTSMLALLRRQLDREKITYEYLDGQTRDREARVQRFQSDENCKLFLISLKAGGLGLNLTAADYVFLLDPWWNPAIEAQAIDRTHRIGQTRHVYACRLIARDTVEEKVVALQKTKRDLADAIISADNSLIRDLGREDLEMLLS